LRLRSRLGIIVKPGVVRRLVIGRRQLGIELVVGYGEFKLAG
jgi:hypothetical protein